MILQLRICQSVFNIIICRFKNDSSLTRDQSEAVPNYGREDVRLREVRTTVLLTYYMRVRFTLSLENLLIKIRYLDLSCYGHLRIVHPCGSGLDSSVIGHPVCYSYRCGKAV